MKLSCDSLLGIHSHTCQTDWISLQKHIKHDQVTRLGRTRVPSIFGHTRGKTKQQSGGGETPTVLGDLRERNVARPAANGVPVNDGQKSSQNGNGHAVYYC